VIYLIGKSMFFLATACAAIFGLYSLAILATWWTKK
jgi:hypothetical protein